MVEIAYFFAFTLNTLNSHSVKGQTAYCLWAEQSMSKKKLSFLQVYDYADLMFHVAVRSDALDAGFEDV